MESKLKVEAYLASNNININETVGASELWKCLPLIKDIFGSYRNFCHYYELNPTNFSKWTKSERSYAQARSSVLLFLTNPPTIEEISKNNSDRYLERKSKPSVSNPTSPSRKKSKSNLNDYEVYCFIDGDNSMNALYSLLDIPIDTKRVKAFVFCAKSFERSKTKAELETLAPELDIEYDSSSEGKDIADYLLCIRLFRILESKTKKYESDPTAMPNTKIYLISADKFINTVARRVRVEFEEYTSSIDIQVSNAEREENLGWRLHEQKYSSPDINIEESQFYIACKRIEKENITNLAQVVDSLNKRWDQLEMTNQRFKVLPFTADNIIHYFKSLYNLNANATSRSIQNHSDQLSAIKLIKATLTHEGKVNISITELEKMLEFPTALKDQFGSWSKFLEETKTLCNEYGLIVNDKKITVAKFSTIGLFSEGRELDRIAPEKLKFGKQAQLMRDMIAEIGVSNLLKLAKQVQLEVQDKANSVSGGRSNPEAVETERDQGDTYDTYEIAGSSVNNVINKIDKIRLK